MTFAIPKLADLSASVRSAFRAELPGVDAALWPNNLSPTAKVIAGALWAIYLRLDFIANQIFAATAEGAWLDRHAAEFGLSRLPAAPASGNLLVAASTSLSIVAGALFARSDGVQFAAATSLTLASAGSANLSVVALVSGASGNTIAASGLSAISGVTGTATFQVDSNGLGAGSDLESDSALRARILFRKRYPPQGGAASDYVEWATGVPGVTRCYVERLWSGAGTVRVFPLTDDATGGPPVPATIAAVQAALAGVAPAVAGITVAAATAQNIDIQISGLSPNTLAVRQAVVAELRDTFRRLGRVSGSDTAVSGMPFLATSQVFSRSWIWQAVANAAGEERHVLVTPSADVTISAGAMPTLGVVSFT